MRKSIVWLLLIVGVAVGLYAIFKSPPPHYDVRVVTPPSIIASLPHWIAEEKGLYKKHNLTVKTISFNSSEHMVRALYEGDADFLPAVSLLDVALAAINKQSDEIRIVSHSRMKSSPPFEALVVQNASSIRNLRDLAGKRVAVYPGATATRIMQYYLLRNGIDPQTVQFIPLPPPAHLQSLINGDVDASHLYDPLRTKYLKELSGRSISPSVYGTLNSDSAIGVTAISNRFAQSQPAAAKHLLQVWDEAIEIIRSDPQFARGVLARRMELTPEIASAATWVDATKTTELSPAAISATLDTLIEAGVLERGRPVPPEIYTPINSK